MREVVGAVRAGHDDAVFLELAQRLKQRLDARVVGGGEQSGAHAAAERREPGDERGRALGQPGEAIVDQRVHLPGERVVAADNRARHLERQQRVAVAGAHDRVRVGARRHPADQLVDAGIGQRADREVANGAGAAQRFQHAPARWVVGQLPRTRRQQERHAAAQVPHRVVQQPDRAFVEPVDVVDGQQQRSAPGEVPQQCDHGVIEPGGVLQTGTLLR